MTTDNFPEIIREAATSPLGILALIILLLVFLAVLFFGKSSEKVRLTIWFAAFGGALLFGFAIVRQTTVVAEGEVSPGPGVTHSEPEDLDHLAEGGQSPIGADRPPELGGNAPERTTIQLAYTGDLYNCNLPVTIWIGDKSFQPQGFRSRLDNVLVGLQQYKIAGSILCPGIGNCQVQGEGSIEVAPGNAYYFKWNLAGPARCSAILQREF